MANKWWHGIWIRVKKAHFELKFPLIGIDWKDTTNLDKSTRGEGSNMQEARCWNYIPKKGSRRNECPNKFKLEEFYDSKGRDKTNWRKVQQEARSLQEP